MTPYYTDEEDNKHFYYIRILQKARYVKIVVPPGYRSRQLGPIVLCEVEIWGRCKRLFSNY